MTVNERAARNAKFYCKSKGMRVCDLENAIGASVGYLSRCANNNCQLPFDKAYAIAQTLKINLSDLTTDLEMTARKQRIDELEAELASLKKMVR